MMLWWSFDFGKWVGVCCKGGRRGLWVGFVLEIESMMLEVRCRCEGFWVSLFFLGGFFFYFLFLFDLEKWVWCEVEVYIIVGGVGFVGVL